MIDLTNNNLPKTVEKNKEKTLKRLMKIEKIAKVAKGALASLTVGAGAAAGLFFGGGVFGAVAGASFATMAVPAVASVPVIVENLAHLKIASQRKKMPVASTQEMMKEQQEKTQKAKDYYNSMLKEQEPDEKLLEIQREEIAFEEKREEIFRKATTLARKDNKEKTMQRLMSLAAKVSPGMPETLGQGFYTAVGGLGTLLTASAATGVMSNVSGIGTAAALTAAATTFCAARTVQSYKEQKTAKKAFNVLEKYTQGRSE